VLAGVFNATLNAALAAAVKANLSDPSPIGPAIMSQPYATAGPPGVQENGGVWQGSLNQPWVWALAGINATDAWEQWLLNTLAAEAEVYGGDVWAGVWTSSDAVNSFLAQRPGLPSWDNFPVLCTHRHAWPLYALTKLAGIGFSAAGLEVAPPALPRMLLCDSGGDGDGDSESQGRGTGSGAPPIPLLWSFETPVVAVAAYANGTWRGRFTLPTHEGSSERPPPPATFTARLPLQLSLTRRLGGCCQSGDWLDKAAISIAGSTASVALRSVDRRSPTSVLAAALREPTPAEEAVWAAAAPVAAVAEFFVTPVSHSFEWDLTVAFAPSAANESSTRTVAG
jgi:hypothetical protein